ncbi:hypothetical protein [Rhizobium mongolense]|uniref:Uncharacterized protein n=1 Tax=Rhizobium mongolense TaxID=57676 RepID=A0A7W6WGF2_9HYPH|nr:hypothetical protein [Rhizobium mongolense]MBB4277402.1 hypothetical protein [Rhizobium mongolense]
MTLNSIQMMKLEELVQKGDRIGYYTLLSEYGDSYASLASGVVRNDTFAGAVANAYLLNVAADTSVTISNAQLADIGLELMAADFAARSGGAINLSVSAIREYHIFGTESGNPCSDPTSVRSCRSQT